MDEPVMKVCKKCETTKPATTEYFHKHNAARDRLDQRCKECASARMKKRYEDNKDDILERTRAWQAANPDKMLAISARYRENHREERRQQWQDWADRNAEHLEAYRVAYRPRRADVAQNRRTRVREQFVEDVDRLVVYERDERICGECNEVVEWGDFELDHIIPVSRGGEHSYANTQTTHRSCNRKKWARMPELAEVME